MLRLAKEGDLPSILSILAQAKRYLAQQGIDQWQDGYPNEAVMRADIAQGAAYVFERGGAVRGIATLIFTGEPTYETIYEGDWLAQGPYACIHRVAVDEAARGTDTASAMMEALEAVARAEGMESVRIDTHQDNRAMQGMLKKGGYVPCGIIYLDSGAPRVALEKRLL